MRISDWSSDVCSSDLEQTEHEARDVQVITRPACERLFDFCFRLAERRQAQGRPGVLTCVDKANVLGSMVFFRRIFDERASLFPADRKSVASGKSVSVRVDLCGRRTIKKKKNYQ